MTITIQLNGQPHAVPAGTRLADLCAELGLVPEQVAVELNRRVVRRDARATTVLAAGDEVEIVTLVGGG
jgi:thiamine biosynthesis protein ThiS